MSKRWSTAGLVLVLAGGAAWSQEIVKHEPAIGMMRPGVAVFVDNGKCPKGQVMEVTAGTINNRNGRTTPRGRECVARP